MHDEDLVVGRKEILSFLRLADWGAVRKRVKEGLPVVKVCGRVEMSRLKYRKWRTDLRSEKGNVNEEGRREQSAQA